jgi:hypothetical protein
VSIGISDPDHELLQAVFEARVRLAKRTEEEAAEDARTEHRACVVWVKSNARAEKSFLWFCDYFDFEPDAVRRAIQEKK